MQVGSARRPRRRGLGRAVAATGAAAVAILSSLAFAGPTARDAAGSRAVLGDSNEGRIPAFSRRYRTSCSTCHVTPGKLNAEGEAFRLNGYRFPDDERLREDDPVPLGAEPWKDLWPEAIWPGEIPGALPLALHVANDLRVARRDADGRLTATYAFPERVHLTAATTLGDGLAALVEVGWHRDRGFGLTQAKLLVHDIVPRLPPRAANLWIGAQRPHLLIFGDLGLDRAARLPFLWDRLSLGDWQPEHPETGESLVSESRFRLGAAQPAIELNGLFAGRIYYGLGAAQPAAGAAGIEPRVSDLYGKLRLKLGGLGLDGRVPDGYEPMAWGGQLLDRGALIEHFTYLGETALEGGGLDRHRSFGFALRVFRGRAEAGVGHVWGRNSRPWDEADLGARRSSTYARAEYLLYPWLLGSGKFDVAEFRTASTSGEAHGFPPFQRARVLPGLVVLIRPNLRAVAEAEIFLRDRPRAGAGRSAPHTLWLRLDAAF